MVLLCLVSVRNLAQFNWNPGMYFTASRNCMHITVLYLTCFVFLATFFQAILVKWFRSYFSYLCLKCLLIGPNMHSSQSSTTYLQTCIENTGPFLQRILLQVSTNRYSSV